MRDDFAVFILTHGRADKVVTYRTLLKCGYTGKVYFILDNEDDQIQQYKKNFGADRIIIFNKEAELEKTDTYDNFREKRAIVYARNASFKIAKELNLNYFAMFDDDYDSFGYRYIEDDQLKQIRAKSLDEVFEAMLKFLDQSGALSVALYQNGDLIGGVESPRLKKGIIRKAMNSFFCRTDRPIEFLGAMNDDVNTYTLYGSRGELFFSVSGAVLNQLATQSVSGGTTEVYKKYGTFLKSMYSVIAMPSCIKISTMGVTQKRIHHLIDWNSCVPKIINQKWKKDGTDITGENTNSPRQNQSL